MKMLLLTAVVMLLFSCKKQVGEAQLPFPPRSNEHPVATLAFTQGQPKPAFNLDASSTDYPSEYGLAFNVPDTGKYILTLWDVDKQSVLLRDSIRYTQDHGFLYIDFGPAGKEVEVLPGKKYMASVFMARSPA